MDGKEQDRQQNISAALLAHVDAGKTTLSEAILHKAGVLRKRGRIENGDTVMDTHDIERSRGITVFSAEAHFTVGGKHIFLLDTPGHVDFSAEMERTLSVLDVCVLVISGTDGVQAHTRTLWHLLSLYRIPVFLFVTKMDYARKTKEELMEELTGELGDECISFDPENRTRDEETAMLDEDALREFLDLGSLGEASIRRLIRSRKLFPVFFGSGITEEGVEDFLSAFSAYAPVFRGTREFGALVYKITHDASGNRLAHLRVTGGTLRVRDTLGSDKVSQIRSYIGEKYTVKDSAEAGEIVTVTGLASVQAGEGLGNREGSRETVLEPVMTYAIQLPPGCDPAEVMPKLRLLEEEDPKLHLSYNSFTGEIQAGLMGEVQAEILKSLILERFGISCVLGKGHVLYRETIAGSVEGVGHYEPLRHYAEVHLLLEALPRGSGIELAAACAPNSLDKNWQNLVLQHLSEKLHLGVLTGSPLMDVRITLVSGRAHLKHTEGGDFRQATYRAVRQGLMMAESVLLEPYYRFRLELPETAMSRAVNDIRRKSGYFAPPVYLGGTAVLAGRAPVSELSDYAKDVQAMSGGLGRLELFPDGYDLCHNAEEVIREMHYVPEADAENSPDSVFCAHGAGFLVPWQRVRDYMHLPLRSEQERTLSLKTPVQRAQLPVSDAELEDIMLREFGPIRRPEYGKPSGVQNLPSKKNPDLSDLSRIRPTYLVVDGYNVIFAWKDLRELAENDISSARESLARTLSNYTAYVRCETVLVFDGYRIPGNPGDHFSYDNIRIVYTKERETADLFIERFLAGIPKTERVTVVTSDSLIQLQALRSGVLRVSSAGFLTEVTEVEEKIAEILEKNRTKGRAKIGDLTDIGRLEYEE